MQHSFKTYMGVKINLNLSFFMSKLCNVKYADFSEETLISNLKLQELINCIDSRIIFAPALCGYFSIISMFLSDKITFPAIIITYIAIYLLASLNLLAKNKILDSLFSFPTVLFKITPVFIRILLFAAVTFFTQAYIPALILIIVKVAFFISDMIQNIITVNHTKKKYQVPFGTYELLAFSVFALHILPNPYPKKYVDELLEDYCQNVI